MAQLPSAPSGVAKLTGAGGSGTGLDITARIVSRFRAATHRHPLSLLPQRGGASQFPAIGGSPAITALDRRLIYAGWIWRPITLQDLAALVDQGGDVDALTLRPRSDRPLDLAELECMLNSTLIRREFASILSHYSPDGLAQKVFASTTFLKRLLAKFRQLRTQVDPSNDTAMQNMLAAQGETTRFYWGEARRLQERLDAAHHRRQSNLRGVLAEHELETRALREEVGELRSQVENLRLLGRTRSGSRRLNVPKLMNFLNRDQTRVNDNWKRLQNLLEHFRDGIAPEKSWSTLIAITAMGDPFTQGSPFATLDEDDSDEEEKDQSGDPGDGIQGKAAQGRKDNEVDLTHQDSGSSEPSSRKTTPTKKKGSRGSSRKVPDQPQLRPSGWATDQAHSPSNQLMFQESDVREIMQNEPAVWDTLRPDVILLMRAGIGYQGSIALLSGDVMTHNLFPPSALADMLASMMFWNRLDESFWTKYVPEKYNLRAELRLDLLDSEGVRPRYRLDLVDADVRVAQEVMDDEHDDTQHDANYNPDDDVDNQDDDDIQGDDSVRSAPKRRRTSISSHSDAPVTQSTAISGTPSKRVRSGSLRRQSPLAQVDSGSLTVADTEVVEVPGPGISSWRHYGILMTFAPSSAHAVHQSSGFPDYAPNKAGGIQPLKQRFILADVQALLATEPWTTMFENRVKISSRRHYGILMTFAPSSAHAVHQSAGFPDYAQSLLATEPWTTMFENRVKRLVLHSYSVLAPRARIALDKYIRFMEENASGFSHGGHWFAIDTSTQGGADMQRERKRQWDALWLELWRLSNENVVPSTIFWEAAHWSLPSKPCYWILMNPRSLNGQRNPYSLAEQLDILDRREPARVQWGTATSDEELVEHIPKSVSVSLLPEKTRRDNPASRTYD
ncbi:hypothetical protein PHMEG_00021873 [Phytophthora megakarya]|uniref:Uncharacterized protein n=1 Tax=Phytophthora megakarya TaxID=4795 RepID=A0A225VMF8_9STRA|nr:hypothetical protein PHMEG_00021873 [Phytophthora megakarya]